MSKFQENCKPILLALMNNESTVLTRKSQLILCRWITMLVIVGELQNRQYVAISQHEREFFYKRKHPPSHWRIWIGNYASSCQEEYAHLVLQLTEDVQDTGIDIARLEPNTQTTTFRVGSTLVHVMSASVPPGRRIIREWRWRPAISTKIGQVWPYRVPINWPMPDLSDAEAHIVANSFFESYGKTLL